MPELPEVETICNDLRPRVEGHVLEGISVLDPRWCTPVNPKKLERKLSDLEIQRVFRKGKYIIWEFEGELFLHMHLRMTGTLLISPESEERSCARVVQNRESNKHSRVVFILKDGRQRWRIEFNDPRRFGTGELLIGKKAHTEFFDKRLGVEPLTPEFNPDRMWKITQASRTSIKALLLNQKRLAGVGNIYADEALFRAGIHPNMPSNKLTKSKAADLQESIDTVLLAGIAARGASIDDYRDPAGVKGRFQDRFLVHLREGEDCSRCGDSIIKIRVAGRGTYLCARCQSR